MRRDKCDSIMVLSNWGGGGRLGRWYEVRKGVIKMVRWEVRSFKDGEEEVVSQVELVRGRRYRLGRGVERADRLGAGLPRSFRGRDCCNGRLVVLVSEPGQDGMEPFECFVRCVKCGAGHRVWVEDLEAAPVA